MKHGKRRKMTADDMEHALEVRTTEPSLVFGSSHIPFVVSVR